MSAAAAVRELGREERKRVGRWRRQHAEVAASGAAVMDAAGGIGAPYVVLSPVASLARAGRIGEAELRAGERFNLLFRAAAMDGTLRAVALDGMPAMPGPRVPAGLGGAAALHDVRAAIRALGGERAVAAGCAWHVLGLEWSLRQWAAKSLHGNGHQACGVLLATLGVLVRHFRLDNV